MQAAVGSKDPKRRPEALSKVAEVLSGVAVTLAESGQDEQAAGVARHALRAVTGIDDQQRRVETLGKMAEALAGGGLAGHLREMAAGISDPNRRVEALGKVAEALAAAGQAKSALQAATDIDDPEHRALALTALLSSSALGSDREVGSRALELLLLTSNAPYYLGLFPVALIRRLVANGELEIRRASAIRPAEAPLAAGGLAGKGVE